MESYPRYSSIYTIIFEQVKTDPHHAIYILFRSSSVC